MQKKYYKILGDQRLAFLNKKQIINNSYECEDQRYLNTSYLECINKSHNEKVNLSSSHTSEKNTRSKSLYSIKPFITTQNDKSIESLLKSKNQNIIQDSKLRELNSNMLKFQQNFSFLQNGSDNFISSQLKDTGNFKIENKASDNNNNVDFYLNSVEDIEQDTIQVTQNFKRVPKHKYDNSIEASSSKKLSNPVPKTLSSPIEIYKEDPSEYMKEVEHSAEKLISSQPRLVSDISKEEIISDILIKNIQNHLSDEILEKRRSQSKDQILSQIRENYPVHMNNCSDKEKSVGYLLKSVENETSNDKDIIRSKLKKTKVPILLINVNIDDDESYPISVYEGDKAEVLAKEFSELHEIPKDEQIKLTKLIQAQIDRVLCRIDETDGEQNTNSYSFKEV